MEKRRTEGYVNLPIKYELKLYMGRGRNRYKDTEGYREKRKETNA